MRSMSISEMSSWGIPRTSVSSSTCEKGPCPMSLQQDGRLDGLGLAVEDEVALLL